MSAAAISIHIDLPAVQAAFSRKYPEALFHPITGECICQLASTWRTFNDGWRACAAEGQGDSALSIQPKNHVWPQNDGAESTGATPSPVMSAASQARHEAFVAEVNAFGQVQEMRGWAAGIQAAAELVCRDGGADRLALISALQESAVRVGGSLEKSPPDAMLRTFGAKAVEAFVKRRIARGRTTGIRAAAEIFDGTPHTDLASAIRNLGVSAP